MLSEEALKNFVLLAKDAERIESPDDSLYFKAKCYLSTVVACVDEIRSLKKVYEAGKEYVDTAADCCGCASNLADAFKQEIRAYESEGMDER